jgi:hypothetical protein
VHSINQHAGYYEIMKQIIRQLVFDQLAFGKHLLQDLCAVGRPPTANPITSPHTRVLGDERKTVLVCVWQNEASCIQDTRGREQSERWREKKWISTIINTFHLLL